ncbi:hypothetical protein SAMN04487914_13919 [Arthrobacter sp. ok909]|uniref:hypothetical protein n=1 Tax=Arthrobacter sp. ok909 TaxID=1761746 RepID=UPI00088410EB|nr:hypothetical protein [Arthrobacter sp. ok909]SDP78326.1 hypothetical protein SAMN04487914_13919 [Arthrobacter sp. ok909]
MYGEVRRGQRVRAAVVVVAVTLLALAWPVGAPLYAIVYPGPDAHTVNEAITDASLDAKFDSEPITQFETTTFRATIIYGTSSPNPDLPTVKVAWSNEAALAAQTEGTFDIEPTSASRQFLDAGTHRPNGGYELTWTWDVTPLVPGKQTLTVSILPTVVVEGKVVPGLLNINRPITVTVDVHPVQRDFDEVLKAAADMKTDLPDEMVVGKQYLVSASMSLAGHADTVSAEIHLDSAENSAAVTIVEVSAAPATAQMEPAAAGEESISRRWTVTSDKPGQVALIFTATVRGQAATHRLERKVPIAASARATEPGPSFWDRVQQPVQYVAPFVALAISILGLWAAWKKRKAGEDAADSSGDRTS